MPSAAVGRYADLLSGYRWLATGLCWAVIESAGGVAEVVRRLGGDPGRLGTATVGSVGRGDYFQGGDLCLFHVDVLGDAVVLLEPGGLQATRREVATRLSVGGRVHSVFWMLRATT